MKMCNNNEGDNENNENDNNEMSWIIIWKKNDGRNDNDKIIIMK